MEEIWKDVTNYEGKYMVSNYGRVKSLNYRKQKGVERILKMFCAKDGYCKTFLTKKHQFLAHRLVAMTFIGDVTNLTVNHKDFNKQNNHVSNLEIVKSAQNTYHYHINKKEKGLGSSKFIGVSFSEKEGKWRSRVTENGKVNHIGRFKTEQEAINAIINYENKQLLPSPNGGILGF